MKKTVLKIAVLVIAVVMIVCLFTGCQAINNQNNYNENLNNKNSSNYLDINNSLAFSVYMSADLLQFQDTNSFSSPLNVAPNEQIIQTQASEDTQLSIENELEEVNIYFSKLKIFLDRGLDEAINFIDTTSDRAQYDNMLRFNSLGIDYTVYYNYLNFQQNATKIPKDDETNEDLNDNFYDDEDIYNENNDEDEQEFQLVGVAIMGGEEYDLKGANEIEAGEQKLWFEIINNDNTDNFVRMERQTEEDEQKFEFKSVMDNVIRESEIKFENQANETKVELKLRNGGEESFYEFKREMENEGAVYKFEYESGKTEGEVKIAETTDELGNKAYRYRINENGNSKEITKTANDNENDDDDDPDNEDEDDDDENDDDEILENNF